MEIRIAEEHKSRYIAFGKTAKKLGERSQEELVDLAVIARSSQDPTILEVFDGELPSLAQLQKQQSSNQKKTAGLNAPSTNTEEQA